MPLHLAIISNRIDVVAALLKAGADMTLASPMTHKTPLDLAESRLSYLLARAQESVKRSQSSGAGAGAIDLYNTQVATRSSFTSHHGPSTTSPALLSQIRGIVNLLRPYVVRQQKLQHGDHALERGKERSWEKADRYMRNLDDGSGGGNGGRGTWRSDPHSEDNFGDMEDEAEGGDDDDEDEGDQMDTGERRRRPVRRRAPRVDMDDDMDVQVKGGFKSKRATRRAGRRMDADETEVALENLMNGLSLLEANRKQHEQQQQQQGQQQQQEQQS
ncbi:hypothetical protein BGX31_001480 [Mortierella sp. GBA43]|nr:hypothetical protein BGX31_001480 [Mortierella sp. GBA43]